jgi:hypothetical protein
MRALVEQAKARKSGVFRHGGGSSSSADRVAQTLLAQVGRTALDVGKLLEERGYKGLSEQLIEFQQLARRKGNVPLSTYHRMREIVNAVHGSIDVAEREINQERWSQVDVERPPEGSSEG